MTFQKNNKYCKNRLGKKNSYEHKIKLKENHVGMLGKKHSDKTKKKMSIYRKSQYQNGRKQWNDGFTKETHPSLVIMSKKKLIQNKKENNPNWKGGKSYEPYSKEFDKQLKKLIKIRDNYKCRMCSIDDKDCNQGLNIHHIDYNKRNCELNNLISLCHKCHSKTNGNRNKWIEYFKNEN